MRLSLLPANSGRTGLCGFAALWLAGLFLQQSPAEAHIKQVRRISIINELGPASPATALINGQIRARLELSPYPVELCSEFLETTLFPDPARQKEFREWVPYKYRDRKPEVIITVGSSPTRFLTQSHEKFFAQTPVVFCINREEWAGPPQLDAFFTGVVESLRRWGLDESDLPPGSTVQFRELSLRERGKTIWISVLVTILSLAALAVYLQYSRSQLRVARDAQLQLSGLLINAQEKERSRLAAELHDDFSQRVALLVYGLGDAVDHLRASPDAVREKLEALLESTKELGDDLHTVSHRLHSSTLESLGLVEGLAALCQEFTTRQGIEIEFSSAEIPSGVHPDAALCLFRITQEGLQNLKKHSGVAKAQVKLGQLGDGLCLSVSDDGRGFDARAMAQKGGLGIHSMEGRARLVGGSFEIHSELGKGTRIEAWVPWRPKN